MNHKFALCLGLGISCLFGLTNNTQAICHWVNSHGNSQGQFEYDTDGDRCEDTGCSQAGMVCGSGDLGAGLPYWCGCVIPGVPPKPPTKGQQTRALISEMRSVAHAAKAGDEKAAVLLSNLDNILAGLTERAPFETTEEIVNFVYLTDLVNLSQGN